MLGLLLCAQLASAVAAPDSTYSSSALRALIERAAAANRAPPIELEGYHARVESEMSLLVRDTLGRELSAQIEQFASAASWRRNGEYELHVEGYRTQSIGIPYSSLNTVHAWTAPTLYGERLLLGADPGSSRDTILGVHPFAADRDSYYRFSGGDTVAVLRAGGRSIPVLRIRVSPDFRGATRLAAFDGEIDLDGTRAQIIRMRGRFVTLGRRTRAEARLRRFGVVGAAFVEFVNAEIAGKYWLPSFQRTEFQASISLFGQTRPVFRIVSTFSNFVVDTSAEAIAAAGPAHTRVTWAPPDSVSAFNAWEHELGDETAAVHSDDFQDLAPDAWRSTGAPRLTLFPNTTSRILRYDRVEGLFTGLAPTVDFRSLVPGLSIGMYGGVAWTERTTRGGANIDYRRGVSSYGLHAERALASTNDFVPALGGDGGLSALLSSIDDADYVDRRSVTTSVTRLLHDVNTGLATLQLGVANDRGERARLTRGPFGGPSFRPNRGVTAGSYALLTADIEIHPNVRGDFVQPGIGVRTHYEAGSGDLDWQRVELGVTGRRYAGPVSLTADLDGGLLLGANPPPQRLFELGGNEALPGYDYKQFAGDRAALFRSSASYRFPIWQRPIHVRRFIAPGFGPGVAVSLQGGWTEISSAGARRAVDALGVGLNPQSVSDATHGVRATVGAGLTFFSDVLHLGVARPIDHSAPWKVVAGFGVAF